MGEEIVKNKIYQYIAEKFKHEKNFLCHLSSPSPPPLFIEFCIMHLPTSCPPTTEIPAQPFKKKKKSILLELATRTSNSLKLTFLLVLVRGHDDPDPYSLDCLSCRNPPLTEAQPSASKTWITVL